LRIVLLLMSVVILAYLTITKSLFVYFSPLLFILVCVEVWTLSCKKLSKLLLTTFFLCVYVLFSYAYVHEYANQYLGQTGLQNFGGRSAWANVMPFVPCAKLSDMSVNEEIKKVILTECLDSVRIQTSARSYLWSEESLMNKMEKVIAGDDRIRGNKIWTEYVLRTVIWEPAAILKATELSIFEYVWKPLSERVNYTVPPPSHPKCATMTKEYFGLTWEDYTDGWMKNFESHRKLFESLDFLALWFSRIVNIISILVLILFWPILLIKRWRLDFLTVYWWLLCVGYLFIIALGGYYVTRYYINFNALVLIFVGYFLAKYWRQIKTNPKN